MSDQSPAELEQEAEVARERVAGTAESIRRKLSAGQLIDEFANMFTGGDLSATARNLTTQVRDNPLPIALMGVGIAWLVLGKGVPHRQTHVTRASSARPGGVDTAPRPEEHSESMMSSVAEGARSAAETISDTVSDTMDGLSSTADRLRHSMLTGTSHMRRSMPSVPALKDQEPLLVAALGLAAGAAIGALLPASDFEKEQIGPYAKRLRKEAEGVVDRGLESAGRVASETYDALKEEADRQGLTSSEGSSIGERVGNVVRSAARSAEEAARDEMGASDAGQPRT